MSKEHEEIQLRIPLNVAIWYFNEGLDFIKKIGIKEGFTVLDFGCNVGDYTIAIAYAIAPNGLVYALDKNADAIDELEKRSKKFEITNIESMITKGELTIDLENNSLDYIIFYDVIYPLFLDKGDLQPLKKLFEEFNRILKEDGKLSMTIVHQEELPFSFEEIIAETRPFFILEETFEHEIMVWHRLKPVEVLQFRKIN